MKAKLVRIGNSRGIRLPKPLIEEAGLPDEVELKVRKGAIVISPADGVRSGWEEAAQAVHERSDDQLVDTPVSTRFDDEEWEW
ncbi:MAG: AbrB/MazE/SpoVT family DNA-binding domain-containing protein [Lentisphaerae bacterium]|nr:AbrB/MazE/SpoVT family DNA-binding domain-containing protein [Lentisphaerota bacterium]